MANKACHIHERLLGEHLAVMPPAYFHGRCLVADVLDRFDVATPAGKQLVGVLTQTERVSEAVELAYFVEYRNNLVAMVMEGDGGCASTEAGANYNDCVARG